MMSHTTLHTLLAVALLSLPLSMPLHADEDGLSAALSIELGTPNNVSDDVDAFMQQKQNGVSFKSDFADDENTDSKDEDGTGTNEGVPNENAPSPSDEKLNNNDPEQINPPKLDEKKMRTHQKAFLIFRMLPIFFDTVLCYRSYLSQFGSRCKRSVH